MICIVWDLLVIHQHHTWQVRFSHMEPGLGGTSAFPLPCSFILAISSFSVTSILSSWSPHTTTMRTPLTSQTVWLWCGTWSTRRQHRSTSSTVRYRFVCFFFPHVLISGFVHDKGKALPSTSTCCTPFSLSSSFKPPPASVHTVSSSCWHASIPHLSTNTCSWGGREDVLCRSWMESEHHSRIKGVGPGWLSCASKQGPCVQTS